MKKNPYNSYTTVISCYFFKRRENMREKSTQWSHFIHNFSYYIVIIFKAPYKISTLYTNLILYIDLYQSWYWEASSAVHWTRPRSLETSNKLDLSQRQISLEYIKEKQLSSLTIHPQFYSEHPLDTLYRLKRSPGLDTWLISMILFMLKIMTYWEKLIELNEDVLYSLLGDVIILIIGLKQGIKSTNHEIKLLYFAMSDEFVWYLTIPAHLYF